MNQKYFQHGVDIDSAQFRAMLAASLMPTFQGDSWGNLHGPSDSTYYAKMAVEMADAIVAEVKRTNKMKGKTK